MKSKLLALLKFVAPFIGGAGAYAAIATDLLTGAGVPGWIATLVGGLFGAGGLGPWLKWAMNWGLPPDRLDQWAEWAGGWIETFGEVIGIVVTVGMTRWKYTKAFWNSTIEPWVIIVLKALVAPLARFIPGIITGLESDNK